MPSHPEPSATTATGRAPPAEYFWMAVAGVCSLSNVVWISFARGPWLHRRLTAEAPT